MTERATTKPERRAAWRDRAIFAGDLLKSDLPDIKALCKPWIYEGVTLLVGPPKCGKTTLARQLAEAVGINGQFLKSQCTGSAHTSSLFISLEEGERLFKRKLAAMNPDAKAYGKIEICCEWERGVLGCHDLNEFLHARGTCRLVVIDSLSSFRAPHDKGGITAFQADYEAITQLSAIAKGHPGLAIVVIHHTRKQRSADSIDDVSGTYGLTAAADSILLLRKSGAGGILHAGGRLWDLEEDQFELERRDLRWHLVGANDGMSDKERETHAILQKSGGMSPSELGKMLSIGRQAAYDRLTGLVSKGKANNDRGVYQAI